MMKNVLCVKAKTMMMLKGVKIVGLQVCANPTKNNSLGRSVFLNISWIFLIKNKAISRKESR